MDCAAENSELASWTFLRYSVLGLIMLWRVCRLMREPPPIWKGDNPNLTRRMQDVSTGPPQRFVLAGCLFVLTEGVGLAVYFAVSAAMDNAAIFFGSAEPALCKTVKAVSLYSMALVTFLPNVFLGVLGQRRFYNGKDMGSKVLFVVAMVFITVASFRIRIWLVYREGYANYVSSSLEVFGPSWRVVLAVVVPPLVDGIQSLALIATGMQTEQNKVSQHRCTASSCSPGARTSRRCTRRPLPRRILPPRQRPTPRQVLARARAWSSSPLLFLPLSWRMSTEGGPSKWWATLRRWGGGLLEKGWRCT
ncbi:unnamed protein product [Prorocentrum cordatum]|uniref:Solute carrier family 40 protein n=1 Tax=Prorocentrum cordatum TaxID=2364126 RepID=A0ABN9V047_9DINO|nr:unnamed protein product [Polarella glacialis]